MFKSILTRKRQLPISTRPQLNTPIWWYSNTRCYVSPNIPKEIENREQDQKNEQKSNASEEDKINPHSVFYRQFGKPFAKVCLLSIATYYGLIGLWELLESDEPIDNQ